jgi:ABC-2 type transport system permease protein
MNQIGLIAWRELRGYFATWLAYALLAGWLLIAGIFYSVALLQAALPPFNFSLQGFFGNMLVMLLFVAPIITMRLFVEERNQATAELLFTSPISEWQIALGKFLGAWGFVILMLLLTAHVPFFTTRYGSIDAGPVWGGYIALLCVGAAFVAFGLFCSTITTSQVVAGFLTFGGLIFSWMLAIPGQQSGASDFMAFISQFSILSHLELIMQGAVDTKDLIYFISVTVFFLYLTVRSLESRKWS